MVRTALSLYVRIGAAAANLALRTAGRGADLVISAARMVVPSSGRPAPSANEDVFGQRREPTTEPARAADYDAAPPEPAEAPTTVAKTVDDEPELVAEFAEPGAEDGASATVEVDPPWDGYRDLSADEVVARIGEADAAELAVVELYERSHKERRTVLAAAERRRRALDNAPR